MSLHQNKYEKMDDQSETPTSETLAMKSDNQNVDVNTKPLTPSQRREQILSLVIIALMSLLTGIDYAIIIPTAWGYVNTFVPKQYAGITVGVLLSVYALSGAVAGVVLGYLYDNGVSLKQLLLFGCLFQIIGNVIYFIGINIYVVITSRFIAGIGIGLVPPLLAEISRRSTPETRTQLLAKILGCRQIGLFLGPCFTIFLQQLNFSIGRLTVTVYNAPGLLMAILWFLMGIVTICLFHDLPATIPIPKSVSNILRAYSSKDVCTRICHMCKQPVIIVLLTTTFIAYFNQTALETSLTPFTNYQYNWDAFDVSLLFAFAAIEIVLVYILINFISKKFHDQTILLVGYIILSIAYLIGVVTIQFNTPHSDKYLPVFLLFVILDVFALPLIVVTTTSLFSRETKDEQQGIGQGIQRAVVNTAAIIGPLYAGALLETMWIMLIPMFIIVVIATILIASVYRSFRPKTTDELSALIPSVNKDNS